MDQAVHICNLRSRNGEIKHKKTCLDEKSAFQSMQVIFNMATKHYTMLNYFSSNLTDHTRYILSQTIWDRLQSLFDANL